MPGEDLFSRAIYYHLQCDPFIFSPLLTDRIVVDHCTRVYSYNDLIL